MAPCWHIRGKITADGCLLQIRGAKDKILDQFIFFNSFPTMPIKQMSTPYIVENPRYIHSPFNLVPMGSPALLINTQALSSNFTTLPSGLCSSFFVLTITACLISPLLTLFAADVPTGPWPPSPPKLRCFWTTTTMRSPGELVNRFECDCWIAWRTYLCRSRTLRIKKYTLHYCCA